MTKSVTMDFQSRLLSQFKINGNDSKLFFQFQNLIHKAWCLYYNKLLKDKHTDPKTQNLVITFPSNM